MALASGCAFVAILGGLSLQMASGKDPALGPKAQALAANRAQKPHKKVIHRTVVVRKIYPEEESSPSGDDGAYNSGGYGSGYSSAAPAAPTQSYSAPAPAPAPVTTSTS